MNITQVAINKLIPYANNARTHSDAQVAQIAGSIKEFGFNNPVLIDSDFGLIAGHGRVLAARKLGLDDIPCVILDHLSEAHKKAYILADNKLALNASWNDELLKLEIEALHHLDFNLELTGFDEIEINEIVDFDLNDVEKKPSVTGAIPEELLDQVWREFAGEIVEQIKVLSNHGASFQGITPAFAKEKFLQAKYNGADYPRYCSFAFHPHQFFCRGNHLSLMEEMEGIADGTNSTIGIRWFLSDDMNIGKLKNSGVPMRNGRLASDFPVPLAKELIEEFAPGGAVLDPCHGWGGRLTGFMLSSATRYVGVDISPETNAGTQKIYDSFAPLVEAKDVELLCAGFEDVNLSKLNGTFDLAITSPPYFDVEKYIGGDQPHIRYANYDKWKEGFYTKLLEKVYKLLKVGGTFCLQVGSQRYPLAEDGKAIAAKIGYTFIEKRVAVMANGKNKTADDEAEGLLIFKKYAKS